MCKMKNLNYKWTNLSKFLYLYNLIKKGKTFHLILIGKSKRQARAEDKLDNLNKKKFKLLFSWKILFELLFGIKNEKYLFNCR